MLRRPCLHALAGSLNAFQTAGRSPTYPPSHPPTHVPRTAAADPGLPRVASLQNAYSLLCRTFDAGLAECCHREGVSLLAYSPLAMGLLSGKYLAPGGGPPEAR